MIRLPDYLERDRVRCEFRDRVLQSIKDFQAQHHRSPQQKEIATAVGISSVSSVFRALRILEDENRIRRVRTQIQVL